MGKIACRGRIEYERNIVPLCEPRQVLHGIERNFELRKNHSGMLQQRSHLIQPCRFKVLIHSGHDDDVVFAGRARGDQRHTRSTLDVTDTGDVNAGKAILRDYIKATIGFEKLGAATDTPPKSLIRMFSARGNPQARNLFGIISYLQKQAGIELHVALG